MYPFNRVSDQRLAQEKNSNLELQLDRNVTIMGKSYDRLFVSSNGLITFDYPIKSFNDQPLNLMGNAGFAPLFFKVDLSHGGAIFVTQSNQLSAVARGAFNVKEYFNEPQFQADSIVVVTFEDVMAEGERDKNVSQKISKSKRNYKISQFKMNFFFFAETEQFSNRFGIWILRKLRYPHL